MKNYKIEIFIPEKYIDQLRTAMNEAGACRLGNYDHCLTVTQVSGFWRPLNGANPFHGDVGAVNSGTEVKAETICEGEFLPEVLAAIRGVHPYEEPLINVIPLYC